MNKFAHNHLLGQLGSLRNPIRVAIIGMGSMGRGLFYQCSITPNIECVVLSDIKIDRAIACAKEMGRSYRVVNRKETMHETILQKKIAICEDGSLAAKCELMDVLIEASNSIREAAQYSIIALQHQKHLVLMNAEIDLIFGPYFLQLAQDNGVIYTSCDGDQHGVIKRLVDEIELWGFHLVMAGNIKGFLDRTSNPTKIIPEADIRRLDYKMATAYTDGTKLSIEMALVANGLNLSPLVPGMNGPRATHVKEVFNLFDFDAILRKGQAVVDYILGAEPGGGIFIIGYCNDEYQKSMLSYYKMGRGPFYLFYRPYHLCHIEAIQCVVEAVLNHRPLLQPVYGFRTNVYAYAKRDLQKGEKLDGIGGYTCYGLIEDCPQNENAQGLPICLAEDITLNRDVFIGEKIRIADIQDVPDRFDFKLYEKAKEYSGERP